MNIHPQSNPFITKHSGADEATPIRRPTPPQQPLRPPSTNDGGDNNDQPYSIDIYNYLFHG